MEIQYLAKLKDNPSKNPNSVEHPWTIQPITLTEITQLEALYNNGQLFPKALRELLYLAGNYCYVLSMGSCDTQQQMQELVRNQIDIANKEITSPFMVIDIYNESDQFLFIYLNGSDNPTVYEAEYYETNENWIELIADSLSGYIEILIQKVKEGRNPF